MPVHAVTSEDLLVVDALFDGLTRWTDELQAAASVALRWRGSNGGRRWTFTLSPRATFADGTPVSARHFVHTWNAMARGGAAHHHLRDVAGYQGVRTGASRHLAGVRARGDRILQVDLSRPVAAFPLVVGHPALAPMLPDADRNPAARDEPVGNGPFRMAEPWAHGSFVRLARRAPDPWVRGPGTPLHEIVFQISDPASGYIAYEQGAVDVATVPPGALSDEPPPADDAVGYRGPGLLTGELPTVYLLAFNLAMPPFDDVRVRRAISLALDREGVVDSAFEGNASPGRGIVPPVLPGGRRHACQRCAQDLPAARGLFRAAGVSRLTLWISTEGDHELPARAIKRDLAAAGVAVTVRAVPFDRFQRTVRRGAAGLYRFGWTSDYPTADSALRPVFHSSATPAQGGANVGGYRSAAVDTLLDRGAAAADPEVARRAYRAAEDLILQRDQAVVPVVILRRRTVVAERVRGLAYGPFGTADLHTVRVLERAAP